MAARGFEQGAAEIGERVLHVGWHRLVVVAGEQTVAFEAAQGLGQHLLADSGCLCAEFGEAQRPRVEGDE